MTDMTPALGARNLLLNCAGARAGDRLLIAYEPSDFGYFDDDAYECVVTEAERMGLTVDAVDVGFDADNPHLSEPLLRQMESFDIILFLARLGDQLRFSDMPQGKRIIVSFALNAHLFGTGFGNAHHAAFMELKTEANAVLSGARRDPHHLPGRDRCRRTDRDRAPPRRRYVDHAAFRCPFSRPCPPRGSRAELRCPGF